MIVTAFCGFTRIHFLFTMLNVNTLFVLKEGTLIGFINKIDFIKKRKTNDGGAKAKKVEVLNKDVVVGKGYEDFIKFFK